MFCLKLLYELNMMTGPKPAESEKKHWETASYQTWKQLVEIGNLICWNFIYHPAYHFTTVTNHTSWQ